MKNFIINDYDYNAITSEEDLLVLSDSTDEFLTQCNRIAIDEAAGYLTSIYDVEALFLDPVEYNISTAYSENDRIYTIDYITDGSSFYTFYTCIEDAPAGTSLTNTTYFEEGDARDQKLIEVIMTISLYHLHKRLSPNNIPDFRRISYDGDGDADRMSAIKWLTMVQNGEINPFGWQLNPDPIIDDGSDEYDLDGTNPADGVLWGNVQGNYEYHHYNCYPDKNIKRTTE